MGVYGLGLAAFGAIWKSSVADLFDVSADGRELGGHHDVVDVAQYFDAAAKCVMGG